MRQFFFLLHKYTGLTLGLLLALIGFTGSLLVFDHALDEKLAPETIAFSPTENPAPLGTVLANARAAVPGNPNPTRIYLQRAPGSPHMVRFPTPPGAPGPIEVSVSPGDGGVLAVRGWGKYTMTWIYRLHYTLLAGKTGKTIVGFIGLVLMLFCISGLVIWWPKKGRWKGAFSIKRNGNRFRFYFDLHKVFGIYLLPVLFVTAFSGVSLVFSVQVKQLVGWVLPLEESSATVSEIRGEPLPVDDAVAMARDVFPEGELKRVYLPQKPADAYRIVFNNPGEAWSNHGASSVWLDQYSGEVLAARDASRLAAGNKFLAWQFPLHNGDALGLIGRWLVLIAGLAPGVLFATGVYLWWRKRVLTRKSATLPILRRSFGSDPFP